MAKQALLLCLFIILSLLGSSSSGKRVYERPLTHRYGRNFYHAGFWRPWKWCNQGGGAVSMGLKFENPGNPDKQGFIGFGMECLPWFNKDPFAWSFVASDHIPSKNSYWKISAFCPLGKFLNAYSLQTLTKQGNGDDQGSMNLKMKCDDGTELESQEKGWVPWTGTGYLVRI